jgi:hypothetical protein
VKRQVNPNSVWVTSGFNYKNGGVYTVDMSSRELISVILVFQGCNNDLADISLVNDDTGDGYDCERVPTVPSNTSQTAVCQASFNHLTAGTYLIFTLGNNSIGVPLSHERMFTIQVRPQ